MDRDLDLTGISEALRKQSEMDYRDTGPKAPHGDISYRGVMLSSRYDVAGEFDCMKAVVDKLPELMARRIESIWCDSKACSFFAITIRSDKFLEQLPQLVENAFRTCGGFNGLSIYCNGRAAINVDPFWPGDDLLFAAQG
jgi:hypothetical protein